MEMDARLTTRFRRVQFHLFPFPPFLARGHCLTWPFRLSMSTLRSSRKSWMMAA